MNFSHCVYTTSPQYDMYGNLYWKSAVGSTWTTCKQPSKARAKATSTGCVCGCTTNGRVWQCRCTRQCLCCRSAWSNGRICRWSMSWNERIPAGLPTLSVTDRTVRTASSAAVGAGQPTALASTCVWPFSPAVTVAIPTAPSVAPFQTVTRAESAVVRNDELASSVAVTPVTPAATVDFPADQPTHGAFRVDQPASSAVIRASKRALPLRRAYFGLLNAQSVGNKSFVIACTIDEGRYDAFLLTETWHATSEDVALRRCVPPGYMCLDVPRPSTTEMRTNHGRVAAFVTDRVSCKVIKPSIQST